MFTIVFPTRVRVDLLAIQAIRRVVYFPHTRGGGPNHLVNPSGRCWFSPHAWGWTGVNLVDPFAPRVFPTRVGVDRRRRQKRAYSTCFPHTRGGGPYRDTPLAPSIVVFPTRVGVDRERPSPLTGRRRFPHTRGGGPSRPLRSTSLRPFSPHAWGWTCGL